MLIDKQDIAFPRTRNSEDFNARRGFSAVRSLYCMHVLSKHNQKQQRHCLIDYKCVFLPNSLNMCRERITTHQGRWKAGSASAAHHYQSR